MAGRILGNRRCYYRVCDFGIVPTALNIGLDITDGPDQIVSVLDVPAADEGIGYGDTNSGVGLGGLAQVRLLPAQDLRGNGDRVPGCGAKRTSSRLATMAPTAFVALNDARKMPIIVWLVPNRAV